MTVYTRERLAAVNELADRRRIAEQARRDAAEVERRNANAEHVATWCAEHAELIAEARTMLRSADAVLINFLATIDAVQVPTWHEVVACRQALAEIRAKAERRAKDQASRWVGEAGERREFEVVGTRVLDWSRPPFRRIARFYDDVDGNVLLYVGAASGMPKVGERARIRATIKSHTIHDGVEQTLIERVQRIEAGQ